MSQKSDELHLQLQNKLVEDLGEKHREFATLTELLDDVVYRCDGDGNLTFLNGAWILRTGWDLESSIGKHLADYIADANVQRELKRKFLEDESISCEIEILCRIAGSKIFQLKARKSGNSWYGSLHDETEQRQVLQALQKSQEQSRKLSLVASRTDNMVLISDQYGRIEWVNQSFERITRYKLAEIKGYSASTFLQGELTNPATVDEMRAGLESGRGFAVEVINYTKMSEPYWVSIDCSPVLDEDGNIINFIAIEREITARKHAESALKDSETTLRHILDTVNEAIFRCDTELNLHFVNSAWELTTGYGPDSEETKNLLQCIHPEDHPVLYTARDKAIAHTASSKCELRMRNTAGEWRQVQLEISSDASEADITILTGTMVDIHERWMHTQTILQAKTQAEELSRERTRFVANMSHEIRTPLNAIIGMSSVLEATDLNEKQRTCVDSITNGGKALLALVHDVLDLSKLDSEKIELEESSFCILGLCEESVNLISSKAEEKALRLRLTLANDIPGYARGDANKIRQILINLLSNAVKFTDQGNIELKVEWQDLPDGEGVLRMSVMDSGIGIAPDKLESLFDPFTQVDPSITRRFGGTGLGLAISRQICEAMGGQIQVKSAIDQGTCFRFSIPLEADERSSGKPTGSLQTINLTADLKPVVDSLSYCKGIPVSHIEEEGSTSCIVLTDESGAVQSRLLAKTIGSVLTPLRIWRKLSISDYTQPSTEEQEGTNARSNLKILVAEDVLANQVVIKMMLSQLGYTNVTVVEHGELAVNHMQQSGAEIVILDIHMPIMDGITAARTIRNNSKIKQPSIIAASADVTTDAKKAATNAGIDYWLPKPFNRNSMESLLQKIMQKDLRNSE